MTDPVYDTKAPPAVNKTSQCRTSSNSFHEFKSDWNLVRICRIFLKLVGSLEIKKKIKKIHLVTGTKPPQCLIRFHFKIFFITWKKHGVRDVWGKHSCSHCTACHPMCPWPQPHCPKPQHPQLHWISTPRGAEPEGFRHRADNNCGFYWHLPAWTRSAHF